MTTPDATAPPRLPWDATDPYPFYEQRRHDGDVVWDGTSQAWLVLGYNAARQVLGGSEWTSDPLASPNTQAAMESSFSPELVRRSMLFADGGDHARLRGSVRDVFTPTFVRGLSAGIEAIATATINDPPTGSAFNFMADIALPLPVAVAAEWLGLNTETAQLLRQESPVIIRMLGALADPDEITAGAAAFAALVTELLPLAADRRSHPCDDLLSFIAADPNLELDEVLITAILIAVAGHETTANLLGAVMVRLLRPHPDGTRLVDEIDPADPALVTELLRLDGPVQTTARIATRDQVIGDVEVNAGQQALVVVAAANRDPAVFASPDEFRLDRRGPAPLSFGYGAHYCLGAPLARLETSIALREILTRRPRVAGPVTWRDTTAIRGPLDVPTVFDA
jgi:cytochrome P450